MPRKNPEPVQSSLPPSKAARLLKDHLEKGKTHLSNRPLSSDVAQAWETVTHNLLIRAFGSDSPSVESVMDVGRFYAFGGGDERQWESRRAETMTTRIEIMSGLIDLLDSIESSSEANQERKDENELKPQHANRVFLVHGHDERALHEAALWLKRFELQVNILREEPNSGRTIIEKFIEFSDVAFAVVLLTADDRGGPQNTPIEEQKPRARQNVILELGFFLGKLGRQRVCVLYQENVEISSDYPGVLFVPLDAGGIWHYTLARELKASGLSIDMNKAL